MEQNFVNQFHFQEPKKVALKSNGYTSFSHNQLIALIKSACYLIAADNCVTDNEKAGLSMICTIANISNPGQAFEESKLMSVNEMFTTIYSMSKEQKDTVLFDWITLIIYSRDAMAFQRRFNLNHYPKEKEYLIDMANRCNIDISAFLNGQVELI